MRTSRPFVNFVLLAVLASVKPALAEAVYTYEGAPFTQFQGTDNPWTTSDRVTGWFEVAQPLLSHSGQVYHVLAFSFTDGVYTYNSSNPNVTGLGFYNIQTDSSGRIYNWFLDFEIEQGNSYSGLGSSNYACCDAVIEGVNQEYNSARSTGPGAWSLQAVSPEPSSLVLFGSAAVGLFTVVRRKLHNA